jgi:hypothetical protein
VEVTVAVLQVLAEQVAVATAPVEVQATEEMLLLTLVAEAEAADLISAVLLVVVAVV